MEYEISSILMQDFKLNPQKYVSEPGYNEPNQVRKKNGDKKGL